MFGRKERIGKINSIFKESSELSFGWQDAVAHRGIRVRSGWATRWERKHSGGLTHVRRWLRYCPRGAALARRAPLLPVRCKEKEQ